MFRDISGEGEGGCACLGRVGGTILLPDLVGPLPSVGAALRSIVGHTRVSRWLSMYRFGALHPGYQRLKASGRNLQVSDSNVIMSVSVVSIHVIFMYVRPCCSHRIYGGVFANISSSYVAIFRNG